jgi:hypothetical protein
MRLGIALATPLAKHPLLLRPWLQPLFFAAVPPQKEELLQPEAKWDSSRMISSAG